MTTFTDLELAALRSIFAETPELVPGLEAQLARATVIERENTGGGFFTTIAVGDDAPRVTGPKILCDETWAWLAGLENGLGFVLFLEDGRLHLLEGFARGPENTAPIDLSAAPFEIFREPA